MCILQYLLVILREDYTQKKRKSCALASFKNDKNFDTLFSIITFNWDHPENSFNQKKKALISDQFIEA